MGIYTTNRTTGSNIDIYSPVNEDFDVTGRHINFHETAIMAVAESEKMYNNIMKSVGIAELRYFEEHGTEVLYEAGDVSAFFEKIKNFFRKLIDKVKAIFHAFIAKLDSFGKDDKKFIKKYEKEFSEKWSSVSDNVTLIKGYKYADLNSVLSQDKDQWCRFKKDDWEAIVGNGNFHLKEDLSTMDLGKVIDYELKNKTGTYTGTYNNKFDENDKPKAGRTKLSDCTKYIKEHREECQDIIRGKILNIVFQKGNDNYKCDASDFSKELFEGFRSGESAKEDLSKKDLGKGALEIISELTDSAKARKAAEDCAKSLTKAIDENIKQVENMQKDIRNNLEKDSKKGNILEIQSAQLSYLSEITSLYRNHKEYAIQVKGAFLQALTERSRQYKAIVAKVVAGGKKITEESYDYTSHNEGTSFLNSVVIK